MTLPNNNNNENSVYYNTVLQNSNKRFNSSRSKVKTYYRIVRSFSVKQNKKEVLDNFIQFCKREHINFSDGVMWAIEEFVCRHHPPNPSPTLDRLFNLEMPAKPNAVCFVPNCRAKPHYQLALKDFHGKTELFNVCRKHKRWKHPKFRFLVRMKELKTT